MSKLEFSHFTKKKMKGKDYYFSENNEVIFYYSILATGDYEFTFMLASEVDDVDYGRRLPPIVIEKDVRKLVEEMKKLTLDFNLDVNYSLNFKMNNKIVWAKARKKSEGYVYKSEDWEERSKEEVENMTEHRLKNEFQMAFTAKDFEEIVNCAKKCADEGYIKR